MCLLAACKRLPAPSHRNNRFTYSAHVTHCTALFHTYDTCYIRADTHGSYLDVFLLVFALPFVRVYRFCGQRHGGRIISKGFCEHMLIISSQKNANNSDKHTRTHMRATYPSHPWRRADLLCVDKGRCGTQMMECRTERRTTSAHDCNRNTIDMNGTRLEHYSRAREKEGERSQVHQQ